MGENLGQVAGLEKGSHRSCSSWGAKRSAPRGNPPPAAEEAGAKLAGRESELWMTVTKAESPGRAGPPLLASSNVLRGLGFMQVEFLYL